MSKPQGFRPTSLRASQIETSGIDKFNSMHRAILDSGVYLPPSGYEVMFISTAHTEELLDEAARVIGEAFANKLGTSNNPTDGKSTGE